MVDPSDLSPEQLTVASLGQAQHKSPLRKSLYPGDGLGDFVADDMRMLYEPRFRQGEPLSQLSFERAGAREKLFFDPGKTKVAIVTCGGLCPGINNVIRSLVLELTFNYGVQNVWGFRYGFQGLNPEQSRLPMALTPKVVEDIHHRGGTILGTSRGHQSPEVMAHCLADQGFDILFCIGGDGTQHGAHSIASEIARRELPISVVGIPKTIDNDIRFCFRTFGYYTAVAEAETVVDRAHVEAKSILNGVGLVKLMGREAGFIAAAAALASGEANFVLVPEVDFPLEGENGFLAKLQHRLATREHAVVVVAEGAGQDWMPSRTKEHDASGNRRLADVGPFLKQKIQESCAAASLPVKVKYFDPSYHIRSVPATAADSLLCERLARNAVHAAMAGKTDMLIGLWHNHFIHVPLAISTGAKKQLSPEGELWQAVLALTGQ